MYPWIVKILAQNTVLNIIQVQFFTGDAAFGQISDKNWQVFWCSTGNMTQAGFSECYCGE